MFGIEHLLARILTWLAPTASVNEFFRDPQTTAILIGSLIAVAAGVLGCFLLLRGLALTSDAISHTVLLGIVVAFMITTGLLKQEPDLGSPWLIAGAAGAGIATVVLTELLQRTRLVKQDAALGLVFPLLFAIAVIFVSRSVDDVHLDEDSVMVGEIGVAWANTDAICLSGCERVSIGSDDPRAEIIRRCTNCSRLGISPRDPAAEFREVCVNCGDYAPVDAWLAGLIEEEPVTVFLPEAIPVALLMLLVCLVFVLLFYKELKLGSFDPELAGSLGFLPGLMRYVLMALVSLVAVAAFDAVGSILVIAFFIIPAAAAYLLTNRLSLMLLFASGIGVFAAVSGYGLAQGNILGVVRLPLGWNSSISASMVIMMLAVFVLALLLAPERGLVAGSIRRLRQRRHFRDMVLLGHVAHHSGRPEAVDELAIAGLGDHVAWKQTIIARVRGRLRSRGWTTESAGQLEISRDGREALAEFQRSLGRLPSAVAPEEPE